MGCETFTLPFRVFKSATPPNKFQRNLPDKPAFFSFNSWGPQLSDSGTIHFLCLQGHASTESNGKYLLYICCISKYVWLSTIFTMFQIKPFLVGSVYSLIFVLNMGVWFQSVPVIPEGVSSQMVGRDVWCSYVEITHRMVKCTHCSVPQLGKTHPKMEA